MAEMSTTYISTLPTGSAGGSKYLVQDDGNNTTKVTVNDAVAAASLVSSMNTKIGSTALPTTAQTLTGAIAEHESDITALNGNLNGDTSWKTLVTGVEYRKVAGIVFVRAYTNDVSISTTYSTVGTLPSGYRPNTMTYNVAGNNGTGGFGVAYINTTGAVGIKTSSGTANSYWFQFAFPV